MKAYSDEELQALLDAHFLENKKGYLDIESDDLDLYNSVYTTLAEEKIEVPTTFANQVAIEVFVQEERKKAFIGRLLNAALIVALLITAFVSLLVFDLSPGFNIREFFQSTTFSSIVPIGFLVLAVYVLEGILHGKYWKKHTHKLLRSR